jgi:nucleotide-binding universal stress UspA family protein
LPDAIVGMVIGSDTIVADAAQKVGLARRTGAVAVDMESHVAQRLAKRRNLPFGIVRVISDTADRGLPPAALVGMRPDGGVALGAILASLARRPGQLPSLIRTGREAGLAFRRLSAAFDAIYAANIDRIELSEFA